MAGDSWRREAEVVMHNAGSTVVPFTWRIHPKAGLATIVTLLTAEPELRTSGIALCLACQLAQLQHRVLLIELDDRNDIAAICGLENLTEADRRGATSTSCIATNRRLCPDVSFNFNTVSLMPAGLKSAAATAQLRELCSIRPGITIISAASLNLLRHQYDFILICSPPLFTPYCSQNPLADFSLWMTHAVLVPYQVTHPCHQKRMTECGTFIRSARLGFGNHVPCEIWLLPLDTYSDAALLMRMQTQFAPNPALRLPALTYQTLLKELAPLYRSSIEMHIRIAHVRGLSALLDPTAQKCLSLRG